MKKLVLISLFVTGVAFADIPPDPGTGKKFMWQTVKIQGLVGGKTFDKSTLVFVDDHPSGDRIVTRILNNKAIGVSYKFDRGRVFSVSEALLKQIRNNLNKIDYDTPQVGLYEVNIELSNSYAASIDIQSPLQNKTIIYTVK